MKFKVHLIKNRRQDEGNKGFSISELIKEITLKMQIQYWGLMPAFKGNTIARVRLNGKSARSMAAPGIDYELDLFGEDFGTLFDISFSRMKKRFALAGIGLLSFGALLGIGAEKAEAVQKPSLPTAESNEKTRVSSATISHTQVEAFLNDINPGEYSLEKYRLAYYHNNTTAHVNTQDQHVNNPHTDNSHTNSWTNESSHQNQWNNSPHQNVPGGAHTNAHVNAIPGDYIY